MPNSSSEILSVKLNNFLHRIDCKKTMIDLAMQHCCSLKRIRRSRNWLLMGTVSQLKSLSNKLTETKNSWISNVITQRLPTPEINDLVLLIKMNPTITINQLLIETGCSIVEARNAIDTAEDFSKQ